MELYSFRLYTVFVKRLLIPAAALTCTLALIVWRIYANKAEPQPEEVAAHTYSKQAPTQPAPKQAVVSTDPANVAIQPNLADTAATEWAEENPEEDVIPDEWLLQFGSRAEMEEAMRLAEAAGIQIRGRIDALKALRLRTTNPAQLDALGQISANAEELGANYFVRLPAPPPAVDDASPTGNTGFGAATLDFLGVPKNHENFGKGTTIAILDTGVDRSHPAFQNARIQSFSLVDNPNTGDLFGHGTAVASLIVGSGDSAPGIAPAAELLSFQVMNANGVSDAFTIAQGIVQAVDAGADVISLSLGSYGNSALLENAVNYARNRQIAIVAAAGNDGAGRLTYPAQYPGVVGVAAIDADSRPAYFSNYGDGVDIAAPGIHVYSAGKDGKIVGFNGTSASTPLVAGAIAITLAEQPHFAPTNAVSHVLANTNDAGAPGHDPRYGAGILNVERFRKSNPGYDIAIADYYVDLSKSDASAIKMAISVQNRGTEYISGIRLDYTIDGIEQTAYLHNLNENQITHHTVLLDPAKVVDGPGTEVQAVVQHDRQSDVAIENNIRSRLIRITTTP